MFEILVPNEFVDADTEHQIPEKRTLSDKNEKVYSFEHTTIPKMLITPHHERLHQLGNQGSNKCQNGIKANNDTEVHCCNNVIQGHCYNNVIQIHCCKKDATYTDGPIRCSSFMLKRKERLKLC